MTTPTTFKDLVAELLGLINIAIPLLFAVVFLLFAWKLFDARVINADDEKKQEEGRKILVTATVVFVIMISVWGIVAMLRDSLFG